VKYYFVAFFAFIGFYIHPANGQIKRSQAVFVEIKGSGVNLTLNYDTRFSKQVNGIGGGIGFGYFGDKYQNAINIPVGVNYLMGKKNNFLECGIGTVWSDYNSESDDQAGFAKIYLTRLQGCAFSVMAGYRYQRWERCLLELISLLFFQKIKSILWLA
jgi:hypothetical protein